MFGKSFRVGCLAGVMALGLPVSSAALVFAVACGASAAPPEPLPVPQSEPELVQDSTYEGAQAGDPNPPAEATPVSDCHDCSAGCDGSGTTCCRIETIDCPDMPEANCGYAEDCAPECCAPHE